MKFSFSIAILFAWTILCAQPASCPAYMKGGNSIEWLVDDADCVVAGRIIGIDWITGADGYKYQALTISISQTLKGAAKTQAVCLVHNEFHDEQYNDFDSSHAVRWMNEGLSLLLCLDRNDGRHIPIAPERFAWTLSHHFGFPDVVVLNEGDQKHVEEFGCAAAMTRDFTLLSSRGDILTCAAAAVKANINAAPLDGHGLLVPADTDLFAKYNAGSAVWLTVPIDGELETLGRSWVKSADPQTRVEGARILRYFKNDENIRLLESLLDDPTNGESISMGPQLIYRKRVYYVRQAAFHALKRLGIEVKKPLTEVLLEGHDVPGDDDGDDILDSMAQPGKKSDAK